MEATVIKRDMMQWKTVYDGKVEIGIESDIVLPDYCGDIERILRCCLVPRLSGKQMEGQRLSVSAVGFLRMVYLTSDGRIDSFETQVPFSKTVDMQNSGEHMSANISFCTDYSNCRAISGRRFEVRAAVIMKAKVASLCKSSVALDVSPENVELKKTKINAVVPVCAPCESFTVMEEYELAGAPISSVVRMTATPTVSEHKIISGKVIMKGQIALNVVYLAEESGETQDVSYAIPVNQVITADGADEGDNAEIRLSISRMSAEPTRRGDKTELIIEVLLEACADIFRNEEIEAITDAYCVGYESECSRTQIPFTVAKQTAAKTHSITVSPEIDGTEIIDVFTDIKNVGAKVNEQGEIMLSGEAHLGVLCKGSEGEPFVRDKTVPLEFSLTADPSFKGAFLDGDITVISAKSAGNRGDVSLELSGVCRIVKTVDVPLVTGVEILSDTPIVNNPKTAMTIYFASAGEDIFDIAKRYNTSARSVLEQNDLSEHIIPKDRTILIPMVR